MKKILFSLILFPCFVFAQLDLQSTPFIHGGIILKNGDSLTGLIRMASSPFDIRFKKNKEQRKEEKIKFKEIDKIHTFIDSLHTRYFYYKNTNEDKFLHFVELLKKDTISIYQATSNNIDLFYQNTLVDGKPYEDLLKPVFAFYQPGILKYAQFTDEYRPFYDSYDRHDMQRSVTLEISRIDYYVKKTNEDKLLLIGSKGNPLYKKFKKTAAKYFEDCPILVARINEKEFQVKNIPEMIEFYKENCK